MTDDDWFERALRELEESDDDDADGDHSEADVAAGGTDETDEVDDGRRDAGGQAPTDASSDVADADTETAAGESDRGAHSRDAGDSGPEDDPSGRGGPFGGGSEDPFSGGGDEFGGSSGSGDPFRGGSDEFGFADFDGPGGPEPSGFDETEADYESDIDRIDVGIEGLDEMILGGVPDRSLLSVIGSAGTGKTTFALQFLNATLDDDGTGVYITLEESREAILSTAEEKGWPFREYAADDRLAVVALDPIEMANSLASIRNDLSRLIAQFGADRLVLDSVSLLEMMYDHPAKRRSEVFEFTRSLKDAGVTTLLTSEASSENPYVSRYGIVEYLTDGVFVLQYVRPSDFRETRLAVEIQKIRDANHSRETKPYDITNDGIAVYRQANIF